MKWIWERLDWPNFILDTGAFIHLEREFHRNSGLICEVVSIRGQLGLHTDKGRLFYSHGF